MGHPLANLDFAANEPPETGKQWDEQARQVHESLLLELAFRGLHATVNQRSSTKKHR